MIRDAIDGNVQALKQGQFVQAIRAAIHVMHLLDDQRSKTRRAESALESLRINSGRVMLKDGALFVGSRIAPRRKRLAVLAFSGLLLIFVGYSTALVLTQPTSVSLSEFISSAGGVIFALGTFAIGVVRGELDLGEDPENEETDLR